MFSIFDITQYDAYHMWFVLILIAVTMVAYAIDKIPLELTSIVVFSLLLLFFHFFPLKDVEGKDLIDTGKIVAGFSNQALIAVIGLLVVGQAVVQTGALNEIAHIITKISGNSAIVAISLSLVVVMLVSAILNNTPVVVIFIPILAVLSKSLNMSVSKVMIPLSYAAILGGMMTLIGSSTNLLVSGTLEEMGYKALTFFDFTVPGAIMALVGLLYVLFIAPRLLPDRASFAKSLVGDDERQFIAQIEVDRNSDFVGKKLEEGKFPEYKDINVRMVQRGEHAFLPPYDENMTIRSRDILVVSATRKELTELLSKQPSSLLQNNPGASEVADDTDSDTSIQSDVSLAEVVVTPTSKMIGRNLEQIGFHHHYNCVVLGIQRESRIIRARVSEIRLAAGDVLLIMGKRNDIMGLRESKDMLLLEWSAEEIHSGSKAKSAALILGLVVGLAAFDIVPIAISAFAGSAAVILTGCINLRQARRAVDSQILLIVAASLAMGTALQATGGASYLATNVVSLMSGASPLVIMSALFLMMVAVTNVLSNNASAVLFTPIAVEVAVRLNVPIEMFVYAVIFACNCSFITPIGYQTNLLVMGPGHHKFSDFIRAGLPLAIIVWLTYTAFAFWYF
ncbi:MAG: SLC13 family permease [Rickettsiales bacterium]|nr:SLC13 family permease [Pseudomonadota bacterium]MDA0967374.1 SLC13 family permease [Pseudomonadota bacterium]MDG4544398.1 SLC13 family permease [Rickettsiales bacterium]MDG4546528.1 SLC13 family permease [Rickettsiales bacterium]MDG4548673.1 SLC13 family permease [Rickettsiales bacterium]